MKFPPGGHEILRYPEWDSQTTPKHNPSEAQKVFEKNIDLGINGKLIVFSSKDLNSFFTDIPVETAYKLNLSICLRC